MVYGLGDRSWACVRFRDGGTVRVWHWGPRRLWDSAYAALRWWRNGCDDKCTARYGCPVGVLVCRMSNNELRLRSSPPPSRQRGGGGTHPPPRWHTMGRPLMRDPRHHDASTASCASVALGFPFLPGFRSSRAWASKRPGLTGASNTVGVTPARSCLRRIRPRPPGSLGRGGRSGAGEERRRPRRYREW